MVWDVAASFLLSTIVIQSVFFPILLVYYFKIIQPNKDKLFWKIRRPNYFIFYILITLFSDTIRCTTGLLLHTQIINQYWYSLLSVPLAYFGGITWGSIRLWLLYYDIKIARKNKLVLLSTYLTQSSHSLTDLAYAPGTKGHHSSHVQQKGYLSVIYRVFGAVIICCVITLALDILGLVAISKLLLYSFILLLLCVYTYFMFKLRFCRCCQSKKAMETSPFRDDWLLLLELFIIWIMWMIGIFGAFLFLPFRDQPIYPVLVAYLTMITRIIITLTMLILPYKLSQRTKQKCRKKISLSVLKTVLSTKSYFYAFVEHLVHEMAIENLTALVEMWQFKYEHKYQLKPRKSHKKIQVEIDSMSKSPEHSATLTPDGTWYKIDAPTIAYESSYNGEHGENTRTEFQADNHAIEFLKSMRWKKLPLSQCIALNLSQTDDGDNAMHSNNKWKQCEILFSKYFDENSYDAVNISYTTRYEVVSHYNALSLYIQNKDPVADASDGTDPEIMSPQKIESDVEFKEKILNVFDASLRDLINNLQDSLTRFVLTDEFKLSR